jgi:FkbM family methyltransferase
VNCHEQIRKLKTSIRQRVPNHWWSKLATVADSFGKSAAGAISWTIAGLLSALPDRVSVTLRGKLALPRRLDYEDSSIYLLVTSPAELRTRLRSCAKEPETINWLHSTLAVESVLYDIGANVGAYSLVAARRTNGRLSVYAFEPACHTFANLVDNIALNNLERSIIPFQLALSEQTTVRDFHYVDLAAGAARHGGIRAPKSPSLSVRSQPVLSFRLDDVVQMFNLQLPTHIKIDVDGGELEVLRGSQRILASPTLRWILVEVDKAGSDPRLIRTILEASGFALDSDHQRGTGTVHNWIFKRRA